MKTKYTVLGEVYGPVLAPYQVVIPNMHDILESLIELYYLDSYLRIVDFSKPANSSNSTIDISTDRITTAIRLPDNIPRLTDGALFISDGILHMLPGAHSVYGTADEYGYIHGITDSFTIQTNLTNQVWNYNLANRKWDIQVSGLEDNIQYAASAFDAEKQVSWYYGGMSLQGSDWIMSQALYRLDKGKGAPTKIGAHSSSSIWDVVGGELVYIKDVGRAGILVLVGGAADLINPQVVSIGDKFKILLLLD